MDTLTRICKPGTWFMRRFTMGRKALILVASFGIAVSVLLWVSHLFGGMMLLAFAYIALSFYVSFKTDIAKLLKFMEHTASGNLRESLVIDGKDEMAEMAIKLKALVRNLSGMVASIGSNSELVAHAGRSLSAGNRDLAERTEKQAAQLEHTKASVEELSSAVQENLKVTQQASIQATHVRDIADRGAQKMGMAVESVEAIQSSAQRMNEIISVIDGLAFQTNILALNAAVEAARAGEAGRGFAVVASEVRSLAQRSSESAKEIRLLINESSKMVSNSVEQIRTAGANIADILPGIHGVAQSMSQISSSSAEQSSALHEITTAIRQLDEITQSNSQMVERAVSQTKGLETRASTLADSVEAFKLQQGTADEAIKLVERATEYRESTTKEAFLRGLTEKHMNFYDRDMYMFALNRDGTYMAFGGNKLKVGTRVQDIPGVNGQALMNAIQAQAEREPGWVEYDIVNPATQAVQSKMSYVKRVDNVYLGCGIYKNLAMAA